MGALRGTSLGTDFASLPDPRIARRQRTCLPLAAGIAAHHARNRARGRLEPRTFEQCLVERALRRLTRPACISV